MDPDPATDTTLVFEKDVLETVFTQAAPYVARLNMRPVRTDLLIGSTELHALVSVDSSTLTELPKSVQFYNQKKAAIVQKKVGQLPGCSITILFTDRMHNPLPPVQFADLDPNDNVCEKVVSLFPYMDGISMFNGHVVLNNCTSMGRGGTIQPGSADLFAFTCTNAVLFHIARNDDEAKLVAEHLRKIAGAAVFNLKGEVVGILSSYARGYDVKLAKKSSYFKKHFDKLGDKQVK
ncbi:uncharacterized protein [Aegilops tauschii subsp. strangulata]|uniref:Uncharacterized protein n=5 Tax=Triticinae TaxID=1648030 RepID=A0A3B6MXT4_WHEAT|nr:uncharacterized protein LOC123125373 isoform X1 [Triticum aestivum]